MSIKGLTDSEQLPHIGDLRKGAPKPENGNRPGRNLDYFRFTSDEPDLEERFHAEFGERPTEIEVRLPHDEVEACCDFWMEEYVSGGLVRRCDKETIQLWREKDEAEFQTAEKPCAWPECQCQHVGRLYVIVPALGRVGEVCVHTTSKHDIRNLNGCLQRYAREAEQAGMALSLLPLRLRRRPQMISRPHPKHGRVRSEENLLVLEPHPQWVERRMLQARQQAMQLPTGDAAAQLGWDVPLLGPAREGSPSQGDPTVEGQAEGNPSAGALEAPQMEDAVAIDITGKATGAADRAEREVEQDLTGAPPTFLKEAQTAAGDFGFRKEDRDLRLAFTSLLVGYEVETYKELTADEADYVTRALDYFERALGSAAERRRFAAWSVRDRPELGDPRSAQEALSMYLSQRQTPPSESSSSDDWEDQADEYFNTMPEDLQ